MKPSNQLKSIIAATLLTFCTNAFSQEVINLPKPNLERKTTSVMKAYSLRRSTREFDTKQLSEQDLSDLLWAAQGQNRDDGHLTSPTAMNKQEIKIYVFCEKGVTLYDPHKHNLTWVAQGDHRDIVAGQQGGVKSAPVMLVLVADMDKFGNKDQNSQRMVSVDTGIACQNINLFCAAAGMVTVPRGSMNQKAIQTLLKLNENQIPLINNPVGYPKK